MEVNRYHRQTLLQEIGHAGQGRLASARVLLVGCGALGGVIAEQLVRAGVGSLRLVDRDVVELTNLQRQVLFDESDAAGGVPKAVAAGRRLNRINSTVTVEPLVVDVHAGNLEALAGLEREGPRADLILDGTDSVETRYLINDVSVKHGIPWVYGACVGTEGRVLVIRPGVTACLRCIFPNPPGVGELPTCDTAGVLGPVAAVVASMQSVAAIQLLTGNEAAMAEVLHTINLWSGRGRSIDVRGQRRENCPACGLHRFEFLERVAGASSTSLCGRNAVQVRPPRMDVKLDLASAAKKFQSAGPVERTPYLVRCKLNGHEALELTLFSDGRLIVAGTTDPERAQSLYARYVGT